MKLLPRVPAPALLVLCHAVLFLAHGQENGDAAVSEAALRSVEATPGPERTPLTTASAPETAGSDRVPDFIGKTELDDPGLHDVRFVIPEGGMKPPRKLSKIDLDSDLDYDGTFDNSAPAEQFQREFLPPGLEVGVGELTRLLLRFKTYGEVAAGDLVVVLEVSPIDRDSPSGEGGRGFASGRIRVWRDQERRELLLDSGDPSKLRMEWSFDPGERSGGIPRAVYLEGVGVSPKHDGDLRLLAHSGAPEARSAEGGGLGVPALRAYDHLLVTVREKPVEKEFINNNAEAVWSTIR